MGLLLNPNARICGKAFGNGSYFANNPLKSAGYCSSTYSRDRGIDGKISIMGVYRVATGNTYEPMDASVVLQKRQQNYYRCSKKKDTTQHGIMQAAV